MKKITIDFETRSEADLRSVGPWVYAEHPSTEILCIGYKIKEMEQVSTGTMLAVPDKFLMKSSPLSITSLSYFFILLNLYNYIFEAHNAEFERAIWYHICHKRWGWPDIPIERWRCSAAQAAALSLPRALDKLGEVLNLPIQKDPEGRKIMLKMCKPRKPRKAEKQKWLDNEHGSKGKKYVWTEEDLKYAEKNMPILWHEKPEDFIKLFKYCIQDVETEHCLSEHLRPLSPKEQRLWEVDQIINTRGIKIDINSARSAIKLIEAHENKLLKDLKVITHGAVTSPRQVAAMRAWLQTMGINLPDLQKSTVEKALEDMLTNLKPSFDTLRATALRRVLKIRQSLSKSSTAKFKKMIDSTNKDGRARGLLMYHGASPGRWTGKRIQPHNLVRSEFKDIDSCLKVINVEDVESLEMLWGDPMRALASCARGMLIAEQGKDFLCADFSSIEMCVNNWLVGDNKVLEAFLSGKDMYKLAAIEIFHVLYDKVTKKERQVGKVSELALGFGGGVGAFQSMAKNYGVIVEDQKAEEIKLAWRRAHPKIVQFWYNMEKAAIKAVKQGTIQQSNKVQWGVRGDFLYCKLPSKRLIAYYKPKIKLKETPWSEYKETLTYMGTDTYTRQWTRIHTYGGKLVENIVQAVARDLLAEAIVRIEEAEYPVILHVHDEILSEVPENFGSLKEFESLMAEVPHWAKGCPIKAEGWRGKRYKK